MTNKLVKAENAVGSSGVLITYVVGDDIRAVRLSATDITNKSAAEIRALAQVRADADSGLAGPTTEREDILINEAKELLRIAQAELDYLEENIPLIPTLTTVPQLRVAVTRLAWENRQIIKALIRLILRII